MGWWGGVRDVAPAAVACALGQPAAGAFRVFKTSLKAGEGLDLAKEWVYLQEGDKFCTMAGAGVGMAGAGVGEQEEAKVRKLPVATGVKASAIRAFTVLKAKVRLLGASG